MLSGVVVLGPPSPESARSYPASAGGSGVSVGGPASPQVASMVARISARERPSDRMRITSRVTPVQMSQPKLMPWRATDPSSRASRT